jgi:AcrR family transcriptional regulator
MRALTKLRPRTKPPEERRDELLSAAQRLFLKKSVADTTIEQITSGADVAKGTFYLYFSSKEDVLAALGDRFAQGLHETITAAVDKKAASDWKGKLSAWARSCATGYLDSIRLHDVAFHGSRPATREGRIDSINIDHLAALLDGGAKAGAWAVQDSRFTSVFLFNGLHSVVDDAYSKEKRVNRDRLTQRLEQLFFRAVGIATR